MTTSNSNTGSYCGTNGNTTTNWTSGTSTTTSSATCTEPTCGASYSVNEIPTPGCYVCHWNGSLLRVSDAAFTTGGFTSFNFTCSDPLTVTFLTGDAAASVEKCRNWANGTNVYCNF